MCKTKIKIKIHLQHQFYLLYKVKYQREIDILIYLQNGEENWCVLCFFFDSDIAICNYSKHVMLHKLCDLATMNLYYVKWTKFVEKLSFEVLPLTTGSYNNQHKIDKHIS